MTTKGFSLIELIVAMSIVGVISIIVLANHRRFGESIDITRLAYEMAVSMRKAQVFGTAVRDTGTEFFSGYGIHFDAVTPTQFFLFSDCNPTDCNGGDGEWNASDDSILETFTLGGGNSIVMFCGEAQCTPTISRLDIVFQRPDPDARIRSNIALSYADALVRIRSRGGLEKTVSVLLTGQISVQ